MVNFRPVNLNLLTIKFPLTAIASILHRISGVFIFLFIPGLIWILELSLRGQKDFSLVSSYFNHYCYKWIIWLLISALIYHLFAGVRHLVMDCGIGESKAVAKASAALVLISSVLAILWLGWILL